MAERQRSTVVGVTASLVALLVAAPRPDAALRLLADAGSSSDPTGPVVAAVALGAWIVAGWLSLTVTVVVLSRLPGLLGRTARAVAGRVAPVTVRRAVEVALGITVAVGVVAPTAAVAAPVPAAGVTTAATTAAETAWDLDWPSRTSPPSPLPARTARLETTAARPPASPPPPPVARPTLAAPPTATPTPTGPPPSTQPAARPAPAAPPPATTRPSPATAGPLVVRSGDTLWSLAEASLRSAGTRPTDRQVAQAWPRWWAANREAVGDDPDLLLPGTVLRPPADSPGSS